MKRYGKGHLAGLLIFGMALPDAAQAAQTTTTFPVTATVLTACAVTANPLSFGNYDPTSATPLDATTTLSVLCTVGTSFTVGLNAGTSSGATVTSRKMVNGANLLNYGLFRETTRTNNWATRRAPTRRRPPPHRCCPARSPSMAASRQARMCRRAAMPIRSP